MKEADRRSSQPAPEQGRDALSEAQALYTQMARQAGLERKRARHRGPLTRLLLLLTITASVLASATLIYGAYNFPDAPIRQTGNGYAGKGGTTRTEEDFEKFRLWEKAMFIFFPATFVFGFAFAFTDAGERRKRKSKIG